MTRKAKRTNPSERKRFEDVPPIGFQLKGTHKTIDIEVCPIGTDAVRAGMKTERKRISKEIAKYTKGATILLRENTMRMPKQQLDQLESETNSNHAKKLDAFPEVGIPSNTANEAGNVSVNGTIVDLHRMLSRKPA